MFKKREKKKEGIKELILEFLLFVVGIASICLFYEKVLLLTIILIVAWAVGIFFWHRKSDIFFFITGAIVGPVGEIFCVKFGAWAYAKPTFLGIPLWLPLAWGLATMLIKRLAETLYKLSKKKKKS